MAAKTTETPAAAFENFTAVGNKAFKENVEKYVASFGDVSAFGKENVEVVVATMTAAGKSVEQINAVVMAYTKSAMEDGVAAAKKMAGAKSVQEMIELQQAYAKSSMDAYMTEMNKVSELLAGTMKETFKPINERVTAAVEMIQAQR